MELFSRALFNFKFISFLKAFDTTNLNKYLIQKSDELDFVKIEQTAAYDRDIDEIIVSTYIPSDFDCVVLTKLDQKSI